MRTINTTFKTFGASVLLLGLKGDSNATEILIDCAESLEEYQGTMAAMSITGPDDTVYPGDISLDEDGIVHWVVAARDCGIAGNGSARVDLVDDLGTVVASAEARTIIIKTNMQGVAPDQIANWTEAASVALQEARAALLDLIDLDTTATTNEAARQLAETGRVSAETLRASAETTRASAETARATAENTRASAETARVTAENTRASAENTRIAAENARVSEFSTIEANAQAALSYIGPSEASSTASAAHEAGSYFIYNGKLYQATADIAIGDTITSGTNCAQVPGGSMGEVSNLKKTIAYLANNEQNLLVYSLSDINGTRSYSIPVHIPAGQYTVIVDNFVVTNPPYDTSTIRFYMGSDSVSQIVAHGTTIEFTITFATDVTQISFYGGHNYSDSDGTTFIIDAFKIIQQTQLKNKLDGLNNNILLLKKSIDGLYNDVNVPTDTVYNAKRVYKDNSGRFWCWGGTDTSARVFVVNPGSKYTISRANGDIIYGFSNIEQGNVELYNGNISSEPVTFVAPDGYTYLYCQDVNGVNPSGMCSLMVEQSIAVDVRKLSALEPLKNNYILHSGKYCSHIGVSKTHNIIIPCQSIFDAERAKRLGFDVMELNVRQTSDEKYVCLHGTSGAFGVYFTDADGGSVSDVLVSSMTLSEIKQNIRYKTIYDKYRTAPYTLQEMLYECKKQGLVPLVEYRPEYTDEIQILDSIMGKDNYILGTYAVDRPTGITAMMASYLSISNPDDVVAKCNRSGGAYMAGINATNAAYDSYTEDDWKTLVNKVHEAGYLISAAYLPEQKSQMFLDCGFDMINTTRNINAIKNGNLCNLIGEMTFSDFNTNGSVTDGVLTLASGNTIEPMDSMPNVFLGGSTLRIRFNGTISLNMGANLTGSFTSDGTTEMIFSTFYEEAVPTFSVSAETETHIYSLTYKASKL